LLEQTEADKGRFDMSKAVMMSIHPKWIELILQGVKTREVRKRAPLLRQPFKVYFYCTKAEEAWMAGIRGKRESYRMNGKVVGEATCVSITEYNRPFGNAIYGTCLMPKDLYNYAGASDTLSYMALENPITYDKPMELSEFGLSRAPQSWQYVEEATENVRL